MKKNIRFTILPFALSLLFLASCDNMTVSTGDGSTKVLDNGVLKAKEQAVTSFSQIKLEGVFNVHLSQGKKEAVTIEAAENILPFILTTVENEVLTIKMKDDVSIEKMKKINVFITLVNISSLTSSGVGNLTCAAPLKLTALEFVNNGVGANGLNIIADKLTVKSETVGALTLKGIVREASINHNGVGLLQAFELKTEKLSLSTDGVGAAEVFASEELTINASGIGSVEYKGSPKIKNIKNNGLGKVSSAD
jgi:Putative auto-transporter adhesin, head GIN domain